VIALRGSPSSKTSRVPRPGCWRERSWAARTVTKHVVDDWYDIREALAGACTARQDVGLSFLCLEDGLALVFMQQQLLTDMIRIGLLNPKNPGAFAVKDLVGNQVINGTAG
jgi:hypothetical protein